jgi:hypothetical protein
VAQLAQVMPSIGRVRVVGFGMPYSVAHNPRRYP